MFSSTLSRHFGTGSYRERISVGLNPIERTITSFYCFNFVLQYLLILQ